MLEYNLTAFHHTPTTAPMAHITLCHTTTHQTAAQAPITTITSTAVEAAHTTLHRTTIQVTQETIQPHRDRTAQLCTKPKMVVSNHTMCHHTPPTNTAMSPIHTLVDTT